jgi:hypothetical protein
VAASSLAEFESAPETWTAVSPVIQFEIANATLQPDGTVVVIISLPVNGTPPQHVYKYGYEFASSTVKSFFLFDWDGRTGGQLIDTNKDGKPDIVRLVYRDGERGDDDLLVNGIIVDPIVFGSELEVTPKPVFAAAAAYFKGVLPTLSGTSVPLATIKIYDGGGLLGAVVASAAGTWSFTPQTALSEGAHTFGATATLPPAQPSDPAVLTMVLDSIAPAAPSVLGGLLTGSTTLVQGTAEAASTVTLYSAGQELGRSVAGANGAWSIAAPIAYGTFILTATATAPAGNCLDHHGRPRSKPLHEGPSFFGGCRRLCARQGRHTDLLGKLPRPVLVAEQVEDLRRRTDKGDASLGTGAREGCTAVTAGVGAISAARLACSKLRKRVIHAGSSFSRKSIVPEICACMAAPPKSSLETS